MTGLLLALTVLVPFGMLCACAWPGPRRRMPGLLWLAPLPGLAAALLAAGHEPIVLDQTRRFTAALDVPGALLLGGAALLWSAGRRLCARPISPGPGAGRFAAWWLLTLTGSLGVFIAGDLGSFYLAFAVVSLAAFGLVGHDGTPRARHAAAVYLLLAVVGEACLLLAFALLAAEIPGDSLAIRDVVAALPGRAGAGPDHRPAAGRLRAEGGARPAACLAAAGASGGADAGLGRAQRRHHQGRGHRADPLPAGGGAVPEWGVILAAIGAADRLLGRRGRASPSAIRRPCWPIPASARWAWRVPRSGSAWRRGRPGPCSGRLLCARHMLAKGALFLGVGRGDGHAGGAGSGWRSARRWSWRSGFGGLPGTGGALGKAAVKGLFGYGLLGLLAGLSAAGSTLLMLHFCRRLAAQAPADPAARPLAGLLLPWLALALAAVAGALGAIRAERPRRSLVRADGLVRRALAGAAWRRPGAGPAAGGAAAVPEGDVLLLATRFLEAGAPWAGRMAGLEAMLRSWPAAGTALLALALAFGLAMLRALP